ncbi:hypothetical protein Xbed_03218 [Xenorhabdus beddingii]|uniref:DNA-binding protein n=1 Tax=Xenorhabdus beddingii TaxID=40578 RepID=A0A1Y2SHP2_9GAMM|nr:DNA-binding protein [Xenorhabdus beddingii]OTA18147.1 hypothetical protein Xbed_03218 [Xenorhabdus beddingii]
MNRFMDTEEIAALFGRSKSTIQRWNSVNGKTGKKYKPNFPDPDVRSCPNLWAKDKIMKFAGLSGD